MYIKIKKYIRGLGVEERVFQTHPPSPSLYPILNLITLTYISYVWILSVYIYSYFFLLLYIYTISHCPITPYLLSSPLSLSSLLLSLSCFFSLHFISYNTLSLYHFNYFFDSFFSVIGILFPVLSIFVLRRKINHLIL